MKGGIWNISSNLPLIVSIQRSAFAMTMFTIVILGSALLVLTLIEIPATQASANQNAVRVIGEVLSGEIGNQLGNIRQLSRSSLVWTALTDSAGRDAYLKPFLNSREHGPGNNPLLLLDYSGRRVLGDLPAAVPTEQLGPLVTKLLADKQPKVIVVPNQGRPLLVAVFPVIFPVTQDTIGALAGVINLSDLFKSRTATLGEDIGIELVHQTRTIAAYPGQTSANYFPASFDLALGVDSEGGAPALRLYSTRNPWLQPIVKRILLSLLLAAILGALVWRVSELIARRLTERLNRLAEACMAISAGRRADLPDDPTKDEIGLLSRTLSKALDAYEQIKDNLETRVADKIRELSESEARYRALFERSKIPMLLIDPDDGSIVDANGAAKAYYGYPLESLRRMHMSDIDQLPHQERMAELALAKAENRNCSHFSHRLASGEIREVEVRSGPLTVGGRMLLYYFIQDITERHAAEMALVDETARMYALLETASDGIHILDENGWLIQFSHSFPTMLGYSDAEISGSGLWDWDVAVARDKAADTVRDLIREPAKFEAKHRRKDGSLIDVEINAKGVEIGGKTYLYASSRDITERKRIERMKGEFVSTVSHELRTPLTSISGGLGLVVGGALGEIPEKAKLMLQVAHKNSLRLAHLINDLLDMEKLVAGKMILDLEVQPLMPLLEHALETFQAYGEQYGVRLAMVERADDVRVCVDGIRLQQVLSNFLSNAAKFSPQDGVVEVAARRVNAKVRVEVVDHGPGIPEEFRSRIFQKFSQADSSDARKKGGTGLGLAISKEFIERMSGVIGFESEEGRGSCFYFELPVCEAGEQE